MISESLLLLTIVGMAALMLFVRRAKFYRAERIIYLLGITSVALTWTLVGLNFGRFIATWRNYQPHSIVTQNELSSASLQMLAPIFKAIFSAGPAILTAIIITCATIFIGTICLMQFPHKRLLPFAIAAINILFLAFAIKSFDQLMTFLPYTADRVVATLILFLAYAASLSAQAAAALFRTPIFGWIDNTQPSDFGRIQRPALPKARPMKPATAIRLKNTPTASISNGRSHLQPIPQNTREAVR